MAEYNFPYDPNSYSASTAEELYAYPPINQLPAIEPVNGSYYDVPEDHWDMIPPQGPVPGPSTNPYITEGFEPVAEAAFQTGFDEYGFASYANLPWPVDGQQPQPEYADCPSLDALLSERTIRSQAPASIPTPSSDPLPCRGDNHGGSLAGTFDWGVFTSHQSASGLDRTGDTSTRRFQPYGTSRPRETGRWNAEAGPSTLPPSQVTYAALPAPQPTGGIIPEASADAEKMQTITEGNGAPTSRRTRRPNGQGKNRWGRKIQQEEAQELVDFVKGWKGLEKRPTRIVALAHALEHIQTARAVVYRRPRLVKSNPGPRPATNEGVRGWNKRNEERRLFGELSRYYRLEEGDQDHGDEDEVVMGWERRHLLMEVLEDLKVRHPPQGIPNNSVPQASTSSTRGIL